MTDALVHTALWLNTIANALGWLVLAPIGVLPGWLSATAVSTVTGVLLLAGFKYTSNQAAIKRVRDQINADLLALKLFKDSARVALEAQGRILRGRKRRPTSRQLRKSRLTSSGSASVATSKSCGVRPRSRSRTHPPAKYATWPSTLRRCAMASAARYSGL